MTRWPDNPPNDWADIRRLLTLRRKMLGLTQEEVAGRISVSTSSISYWESGAKLPTLGNFLNWCSALEIDLGFAMTEEVR